MDIGTYIKIERIKQKLSLRDLSNRSGVAVTTISSYENGQRKIELIKIDKILKTLGVSYVIGENAQGGIP